MSANCERVRDEAVRVPFNGPLICVRHFSYSSTDRVTTQWQSATSLRANLPEGSTMTITAASAVRVTSFSTVSEAGLAMRDASV